MEAWMEWTFEGGLNSFGSRSRREPRPVINLACMMVHGMSAFVRMKLGGTAEVKAPVL